MLQHLDRDVTGAPHTEEFDIAGDTERTAAPRGGHVPRASQIRQQERIVCAVDRKHTFSGTTKFGAQRLDLRARLGLLGQHVGVLQMGTGYAVVHRSEIDGKEHRQGASQYKGT